MAYMLAFDLVIGYIYSLFVGFIGIIPSFHINNILPFLDLLSTNDIITTIIIVSGSILFSFITFIPTAFLLIPSESSFATLMPTQKLYNQGKAFYAVYLSSIGALYGMILSLPIIFVFIALIPLIEEFLMYLTIFILILTAIFLIQTTKNNIGYLIIILSGVLGILTLSSPLNIENPMLVMIVGLFGLGNIIYLLKIKPSKTNQKLDTYKTSFLKKLHIGFIASIMSVFVTLFPGIGSGIATYFGVKTNKLDTEGYIMLNGAINTLVISISFLSAILIGKTRTGSAVYFSPIVKNTILQNPFLLTALLILSVFLSFFITIYTAKKLTGIINKLKQEKIIYVVLLLVLAITTLFTNTYGLLIFTLGGMIGYLTIISKNPRILMLNSIITPVLISYII